MAQLLRIGHTDEDVKMTHAEKKKFFKLYHAHIPQMLKFRDDDKGSHKWNAMSAVPGKPVRELITFLKRAGFMPNGSADGIFGYVTQAAVRLFQEYVRTQDEGYKPSKQKKHPHIHPDGVVGNDSYFHINRWKEGEKQCTWGQASSTKPTQESNDWFAFLEAAKTHYKAEPSATHQSIEKARKKGSTFTVDQWTFDKKLPQLIGIRRNAHKSASFRPNDDLFILLINGMVFKFWGSTDSNPNENATRESFLAEGQHLYDYGWHKISKINQAYRALRPAGGVLVTRDWLHKNALTKENIAKGLDPKPNGVINIHWSGLGGYNFSAGCQVMSGGSYINHKGELISCKSFAAVKSRDVGTRNRLGQRNTKAAYNIFTDLILVYSPLGTSQMRYTLFDESVFDAVDSSFSKDDVKKWVKELRKKGL